MKKFIALAVIPFMGIACSKKDDKGPQQSGVYKMTSLKINSETDPLAAFIVENDLQDPVDHYAVDLGNNTFQSIAIDNSEGYESYTLSANATDATGEYGSFLSCSTKAIKTVRYNEASPPIVKQGNRLIVREGGAEAIFTEISAAEAAAMRAKLKTLKRECENDSNFKGTTINVPKRKTPVAAPAAKASAPAAASKPALPSQLPASAKTPSVALASPASLAGLDGWRLDRSSLSWKDRLMLEAGSAAGVDVDLHHFVSHDNKRIVSVVLMDESQTYIIEEMNFTTGKISYLSCEAGKIISKDEDDEGYDESRISKSGNVMTAVQDGGTKIRFNKMNSAQVDGLKAKLSTYTRECESDKGKE